MDEPVLRTPRAIEGALNYTEPSRIRFMLQRDNACFELSGPANHLRRDLVVMDGRLSAMSGVLVEALRQFPWTDTQAMSGASAASCLEML